MWAMALRIPPLSIQYTFLPPCCHNHYLTPFPHLSFPIVCSKKRPKTKSLPAKHRPGPAEQHVSSSEDISLGIGTGATTLAALLPRGDYENSGVELQQLTADSQTFWGSSWQSSASGLEGVRRYSKTNDGGSEATLGSDTIDGKIQEGERDNSDQGEYEWFEEEEEDERFEYWEGDLGPMTAEEEAELLRDAEKELAELKKSSISSLCMEQEGPNAIDYFGEMVKQPRLAGIVKEGDFTGDKDSPIYGVKSKEDEDEANAWMSLSTNSNRFGDVDAVSRDESGLVSSRVWKDGDSQGSAEKVDKKGRGVPAVMRCFDRAKIYVKAGDGGNGVVAFRREKHVPFGGPSGGNGGRGGNVYIEADPSMNSLLPFRKNVHFRAGRGSHGQGKSQDGGAGNDTVVMAPVGTVVKEAEQDLSGSGKVLLELTEPGQRELLLPGGRGGRGNAAFKSGHNKTPQIAENGEEGVEMWLELELKLVADVGIIGVPNAGKSTLLSAISAARPEIADYPFTTLLPNLGVVPLGFDGSMVVADLPGLLEGAHLGVGLGHEFLRHTERCRVLVQVVDGMTQQAENEYEAVRLELELFNPALAEKSYVVAFNKMDIPEAAERWNGFQTYLQQRGIEAICISAATKMGTAELVHKAYNLSKKELITNNVTEKAGENPQLGDIVRKQRNAPLEEFEIVSDKYTRTWRVQGAGLERFIQMTNWEYFEAVKRFQHVLDAIGVNTALKKDGIKEGDTVIVGQMELIWHDTENLSEVGDWGRGTRGSRLWPH